MAKKTKKPNRSSPSIDETIRRMPSQVGGITRVPIGSTACEEAKLSSTSRRLISASVLEGEGL